MSRCTRDRTEEAAQLARIFAPGELLNYLSTQLGVLKNQAQNLLGLCGLAVTVTGFSGTHMIAAGRLSATSMVLGIALILAGALTALWALLKVAWVSQVLCEDLAESARRVLEHRDRMARRLAVSGVLVGAGLAAYLFSVAAAAWKTVGA